MGGLDRRTGHHSSLRQNPREGQKPTKFHEVPRSSSKLPLELPRASTSFHELPREKGTDRVSEDEHLTLLLLPVTPIFSDSSDIALLSLLHR